MFSLHKSVTSGYPNAGFKPLECYDVERLGDFVAKRVYSPIIWAGGSRGEWKYSGAYWCALDFDNTLTKSQAQEALHGFRYILAPTKSDGKEKVHPSGRVIPATERFRVLLPFSRVIYDKELFSWNMKCAIRRFNADPLPYDAGRVWQPSSHVEVMISSGHQLDVIDSIPVEETQKYKQEQNKARTKWRADQTNWPRSVKQFLDGEIDDGNRNDMLFTTACFLFEAGWTVDDVRKEVMQIPEMTDHDKTESTIKSAAKRTGAAYF